jgi:hypothetical protein
MEKNMPVYEMRTYTAMPGRLPALLARFEKHTLGIWDRLGIKAEGFFTSLIGPSSNDLIYFLVWKDLAEREAKWAEFLADQQWQDVRRTSEDEGPLLTNIASQFLAPAAFARLAS